MIDGYFKFWVILCTRNRRQKRFCQIYEDLKLCNYGEKLETIATLAQTKFSVNLHNVKKVLSLARGRSELNGAIRSNCQIIKGQGHVGLGAISLPNDRTRSLLYHWRI